MKNVMHFITDNQQLFEVGLIVLAFVVHKIIDYMAKRNPAIDGWDKLEPYSQKAYELIHRGVEYWGGSVGATSVQKADEYTKMLEAFDKEWNEDRLKAVKNLIGWYLSMKQKVEKISANPSQETLTKDTVARE